MTFTLIVLAATLLAAVWLAVDLLRPALSVRLSRPSKPAQSSSGIVSYEPIARLLQEDDFEYVASEADLVERLRGARRSAMRLYLRQVRRDYLDIWQVCRLLAPISPDPGFVSRLSRQYWSFHWAYANVQFRCLAFGSTLKPAAADRLVAALTEIREQAQGLLAVSDSALSLPSAA